MDEEWGSGMRIGVIAQSLVERVVLAAGFVPTPIIASFPTIVLARSIMAATQLGIFTALESGSLTASAVATLCRTDPAATAKLLIALAGSGYVRAGGDRYTLTSVTRTWLLPDAPHSIYDYILFNYTQWEWLSRCEEFIRTGHPIAFHDEMTEGEWDLYQRGMRSIARLTAPEVSRRVPVPANAHAMLDIGGANGVYAAALCRRHPDLHATILDLPEAIAAAATFSPPDDLSTRITYRADDALTADLDHDAYDLVFVANLVHHFDEATNRALAQRVAAALRPGGCYVIQDGVRERPSRANRQFGALGDLFFALTSAAGTWSFAEMAAWQCAAGLRPRRPIRLLTAPSQGLQVATKP